MRTERSPSLPSSHSGWSYENAKTQLDQALEEYFLQIAQEWADEELSIVRISQIENKLLNLPCVIDITDTTIDGKDANLTLAFEEIPILKTLEVRSP